MDRERDDPTRLPDFVEAVIQDADRVIDIARLDPQALHDLIEQDASSARFSPILDTRNVAAALLADDGAVLSASTLFVEERGASHIDPASVQQALRLNRPVVAPVALERGQEATPAVFIYAPLDQARPVWRLPPDLNLALSDGAVVVLTTLATREGPIAQACANFGLTPAQTRLVAQMLRARSIKDAALSLGISHVTARESLAEIYKRTGARRLPDLVASLSALAFGVLPSRADHAALLIDVWGLSPKQASIAFLAGGGAAREEVARALGLSLAVVRKELDHIFTTLGVTTASGLAKAVTTISAAGALLGAAPDGLGPLDPRAEPLRLTPRVDGGRIAWSDYGPPGGRPVLIVHSSSTSRFAPTHLVASLREAGYRPLAIDRPGFGLSDPKLGCRPGEHDPFAEAVDDFIAVLDVLKLPWVDVVARGGAQVVVAIAQRAPERLGRVVLVNPDPHTEPDDRRRGALGAFKEAYFRRPEMIGHFARLLGGGLTRERAVRMMRQSVRGSAPDERALADPRFVEDYWRSLRMFGAGRVDGYVAEQIAIARGKAPEPLASTEGWRVLIGAQDPMHDPAHVERYWRAALPDAAFQRVEDAGRFLAMTHPQAVLDALRSD